MKVKIIDGYLAGKIGDLVEKDVRNFEGTYGGFICVGEKKLWIPDTHYEISNMECTLCNETILKGKDVVNYTGKPVCMCCAKSIAKVIIGKI